jgi:hypothetical protein
MSEDVRIKAARAEQLLEDEVLTEAMEGIIRDALFHAGTVSLANAPECIGAIAALQAAGDLNRKLREYVTAGKAAERKPFKVA